MNSTVSNFLNKLTLFSEGIFYRQSRVLNYSGLHYTDRLLSWKVKPIHISFAIPFTCFPEFTIAKISVHLSFIVCLFDGLKMWPSLVCLLSTHHVFMFQANGSFPWWIVHNLFWEGSQIRVCDLLCGLLCSNPVEMCKKSSACVFLWC